MNAASQKKQTLTVAILSLIGIGLLIAIFNSSIWWVSLTAPNYPEESFPDGVRIEFHVNGVFNGCTLQHKAEIQKMKHSTVSMRWTLLIIMLVCIRLQLVPRSNVVSDSF